MAALSSPSPSPSPSPTPLAQIARVATGTPQTLHRLPVAASVLDARAISALPATTGDDLLRALPGFDRDRSNSAFTNYGQLRVSFTGAGNDRGLVLADGVPAQDAFGGQVDWAEFPAADIVRAELLRGAGSALYGAGAIGGVLDLQTFGPDLRTGAPQGAVQFSAGTHDAANGYVRGQAWIARAVSASFSASSQTMAYDDLAPGYQSAIDRPALSRQTMESLRVRYAPTAAASLTYAYRGAWDYQQEGRPNYDMWRRLHQQSLAYARSWQKASLDVSGYVREALVTNRSDAYPQAPGTLRYTQEVPTNESGVFATWRLIGRNAQLSVRADERTVNGISDQYGPTSAFQSEGSGTQRVAGLAVQEQMQFGRAALVLGARADAVNFLRGSMTAGGTVTQIAPRTDRAVSPRVALRYNLSKTLVVRISDGAGFRAPFLNELVRGYQIGSTQYRPNPSLVPERSGSLSMGLDWSRGGVHVALDGIRTVVSDAISFRTIAPNVQQRSNFDRTQTDGLTLTGELAFPGGARLNAHATAQNPRVIGGDPATDGKLLPYVPSVSAGSELFGRLGRVEVGVSVDYLGRTFADDLNTQLLPAAFVAGFHATAPLGPRTAAFLNVSNAGNARYLSSIDRYGPPMTVTLGIRAALASPR